MLVTQNHSSNILEAFVSLKVMKNEYLIKKCPHNLISHSPLLEQPQPLLDSDNKLSIVMFI